MSNRYFSHKMWLLELRNHLAEERYAAGPSRQCLAVARSFLDSLDKQHVGVSAAQPTNVEAYVQQVRRVYRRRHGHQPDYKGWRYLHTNGIHMLLRWVQGQWPPVSRAVTPAEIAHNEICSEYAQWMTSLRGFAPQTVSHRRDEAARFLDWLGDRATKEGLALLTTVDVDGYMKYRSGLLCR